MISISNLNPTTTTTSSFSKPSHHHSLLCLSNGRLKFTNRTKFVVCSASAKLPFTPPPAAPPGQVYQPYRPPPSPLPPKYRNIPITEVFDILRNRLGLWHDYAPLISSLLRDGFTPSSIEEVTGISGVEQNNIVVATQVRESLLESKTFPQELLPYFDSNGGPDLLNELRRLNVVQRADSAKYIIDKRFEPRSAMELSRAIRDFPRRRGEFGWEYFSPDSPGDCLAFTQFRFSREAIVDADRIAALEKALEYVETDKARERIKQELERGEEARKAEEEQLAKEVTSLKVVRLRYGEVAEASSVSLLPVVTASEGAKGVAAAPGKCKSQGELGVVMADKAWTRWAVMPSWAPVLAAEEAVALELDDTKGLPWPTMCSQEKVLVLVDRTRKEVVEDGAYLVEKEGSLVVDRGIKLKEAGVQTAVATVVMVIRPPKDDDDMISDDEWD